RLIPTIPSRLASGPRRRAMCWPAGTRSGVCPLRNVCRFLRPNPERNAASPQGAIPYDRLGGTTLPRALGLVKGKQAEPFAGLPVPGRSEEGRKNTGGAVGCPAPDLYGCHPRPVNGYIRNVRVEAVAGAGIDVALVRHACRLQRGVIGRPARGQ